MKFRIYVIVFVFFLLKNTGFSQSFYETKNIVNNYSIDVNLNTEKKILEGNYSLEWKNTSADTLHDLRFHLYLNAFKNNKSTFMQEIQNYFEIKEDESGWIKINFLKVNESENLSQSLEFIQPDDKNKEDETVVRISPEKMILPNEIVKIEIKWEAKLPKVIARNGYGGDFFMIAQWFPKIGVYESGKGWNCHQYHANSEFFADFANYDVNITLPNNYKVGATGQLVKESSISASEKKISFYAKNVVDFAWTASPKFKEFKTNFEETEITLLLQPEHVNQASRHIQSLKAAMNYFQLKLGKYPYPSITVIDPDVLASGAGGMEYPMLITVGTYWKLPNGIRFPELVTVHEFGHQYFMGILASNEFEEAWLDEGINSYFEVKIMDFIYGASTSVIKIGSFQIGDGEFTRTGFAHSSQNKIAEIARLSWDYPQGGYGMFSYQKPATMLLTLERLVGSKVMDEILKTYYEQFQFKHPKTTDFIAITNEIVKKRWGNKFGENMDWFFQQNLYGSNICDYKIFDIKNTANKSIVKIQRIGEVTFPQEILVCFEDGELKHESWNGLSRTFELKYPAEKKIKWAKIDPQNKILLDVNLNNNSFQVKKDKKPFYGIFARILFFIQNLIQYVLL